MMTNAPEKPFIVGMLSTICSSAENYTCRHTEWLLSHKQCSSGTFERSQREGEAKFSLFSLLWDAAVTNCIFHRCRASVKTHVMTFPPALKFLEVAKPGFRAFRRSSEPQSSCASVDIARELEIDLCFHTLLLRFEPFPFLFLSLLSDWSDMHNYRDDSDFSHYEIWVCTSEFACRKTALVAFVWLRCFGVCLLRLG